MKKKEIQKPVWDIWDVIVLVGDVIMCLCAGALSGMGVFYLGYSNGAGLTGQLVGSSFISAIMSMYLITTVYQNMEFKRWFKEK